MTHTFFFIFYFHFSMSILSLTSFIRLFHLPFRPVFVLCALHFSSFLSFLTFFSIRSRSFLSFFTFSATPLDEGSACRRDLYLTTHRHSCRRRDSNPQSKRGGGPRPTPQNARPLNLAIISSADVKYNSTTSEHKP